MQIAMWLQCFRSELASDPDGCDSRQTDEGETRPAIQNLTGRAAKIVFSLLERYGLDNVVLGLKE